MAVGDNVVEELEQENLQGVYVLVECASSQEIREKYGVKKWSVERIQDPHDTMARQVVFSSEDGWEAHVMYHCYRHGNPYNLLSPEEVKLDNVTSDRPQDEWLKFIVDEMNEAEAKRIFKACKLLRDIYSNASAEQIFRTAVIWERG